MEEARNSEDNIGIQQAVLIRRMVINIRRACKFFQDVFVKYQHGGYKHCLGAFSLMATFI
jgi:hypothetical protein